MTKSNLGQGQIIQFVYDPDVLALRTIPGGGQLVTEQFDYIDATYPSGTQEVYIYKLGGSGGVTVATVTVNYTDSTKDFVDNVAKA